MRAALQLVGKWPGYRQLFQLPAVGILIYLTDSISGKTFLVDTGAASSVFPHKGLLFTAERCLSGPDNKPILSWGNITKKLCFGGQFFSCTFVLAAVSRPIPGFDFLAHQKLLVDAAARHDCKRRQPFPATPQPSCPQSLPSVKRSGPFWLLFQT
jgi:hypothetical protein